MHIGKVVMGVTGEFRLDYMLLHRLSLRPCSGYDLTQWLRVEGQFLQSRTHASHVYRTLARITEAGWAVFEVDPREGRPDAKVYTLTASGHRELLRWATSPYEPGSRFADPHFTCRFMIVAAIDDDATVELVQTELAYRRTQVARFRHRDRTLSFENPIPEVDTARQQDVYDRLHQRGMRAVDAWIEWLNSTLSELESRRAERQTLVGAGTSATNSR